MCFNKKLLTHFKSNNKHSRCTSYIFKLIKVLVNRTANRSFGAIAVARWGARGKTGPHFPVRNFIRSTCNLSSSVHPFLVAYSPMMPLRLIFAPVKCAVCVHLGSVKLNHPNVFEVSLHPPSTSPAFIRFIQVSGFALRKLLAILEGFREYILN